MWYNTSEKILTQRLAEGSQLMLTVKTTSVVE